MDAVVDGELQNFKAKGGAYTRENFFAKDPSVLEMVKDLSDEDIYRLNRGGHDTYKVYAAYHKAVNSNLFRITRRVMHIINNNFVWTAPTEHRRSN